MVTKQVLNFESYIDKIEQVNPLFQKAKVRVLYTGANRNYSYFSKEAVEKAIKTLANVPVVGEYLEEEKDFGGHGVSIEFEDDMPKMVLNTRPYGVVGENFTYDWEEVEESDGTINEYLVVDGVYLWSGRYDELNTFSKNNSMSQSMEIMPLKTYQKEIDGHEYTVVEDFLFSALCILGTEVDPAFQSSSITTYSLNKDDFKKDFLEMVSELKFSLEKGGEEVSENEKDYEKTAIEEIKEKQFEEESINSAEPESETESGEDNEVLDTGDDGGETDPIEGDGDGGEEPEPEPEPEPEVDTSELQNLVDSSNYNSDDYTDESYTAYSEALSQANDVLSNADATQEDVDEALQALQNAINGLEDKPQINKDELQSAIANAEKYDSKDYTEESFSLLEHALDRARMFLSSDSSTQEQIDDAKNALQLAVEGLEAKGDKTALQSLVDVAKEYTSEGYTEESFASLQSQITSAQAVLDNTNATQQQVDEAQSNLQSAIDGLEERPKANKTALQSAVDGAKEYSKDKYTEESFKALQEAIRFAEEVLDEEYAEQSKVDSAKSDLDKAISALEEKTVENPDDDDSTAEDVAQLKRKWEDKEEYYQLKLQTADEELQELRQYKRSREEEDLKKLFAGKLTDNVLDKIFSAMKDSTLEDIEKELYVEIGKMNFSLETEVKNTNKIVLPSKDEKAKNDSPYSALEVYLNKQ